MKSIYIGADLSYHMATFYPIDFNKSIEKKQLVYKTNPDLIMEYIVLGLSLILTIGVPSFLAIITFKSLSDIFQILLCLLWDGFIIANLILFRSLVKVEGKSKRENKNDIIKILSKDYQLQNEHPMRNGMIRDIKVDSFSRWGRVITCLFDDNAVYLNVTTVYKGDSFSCFNGLLNYIRCKGMAKDFQRLQSAILEDIEEENKDIPSDNQ